jgi:hypothetical protein
VTGAALLREGPPEAPFLGASNGLPSFDLFGIRLPKLELKIEFSVIDLKKDLKAQ